GADVLRDFHDAAAHDPVSDPNVLGESAARRFAGAGTRADLLVGLTLRVGLGVAVVAVTAGNVVEDHHAIADGEVRDAAADLNDGSGHLVSEDARRGVRAGVDLLQISTADAACVDLHEQLTYADLRHGHGLDADIVDAAIDGGGHRSRNRVD